MFNYLPTAAEGFFMSRLSVGATHLLLRRDYQRGPSLVSEGKHILTLLYFKSGNFLLRYFPRLLTLRVLTLTTRRLFNQAVFCSAVEQDKRFKLSLSVWKTDVLAADTNPA